MQFIVFAAFAIVLSVPENGPPWPTVRSFSLSAMIVGAYVVAATLAAALSTRLVARRLEREPAWLPSAQRQMARGGTVVRAILFAGLLATVYGTSWARMVRSLQIPLGGGRRLAVASVWGLDELVILAPFFLAILLSWVAIYPADRAIRQVALELRLWSASPARPVWRLRQFLSFMFRQHVLIIAVPMVLILIANDFAWQNSDRLRGWSGDLLTWLKGRPSRGVVWADQAVLVVVAGIVFFFAPVMLRHIWHTRPLPPGELRERLEALCRRVGLTYRRILIWESDGMVVNAAVMGLVRPVRYILLSDGLLEMMEDQKIEAVFGHEAGHVKRRHIEFYLLFATLSMFIVGGLAELLMASARKYPHVFPAWREMHDYLQIGAMGLVVLVWGLGFGVVSRRFEWQADLFGTRSITPDIGTCDRPCYYHGSAGAEAPRIAGSGGLAGLLPAAAAPDPRVTARGRPVCATAADIFADALHRIAQLNGIPIEARSWRHSSIGNRMKLLRGYADDPAGSVRLERSVALIKGVLLLGNAIGVVVGAWLYWPL